MTAHNNGGRELGRRVFERVPSTTGPSLSRSVKRTKGCGPATYLFATRLAIARRLRPWVWRRVTFSRSTILRGRPSVLPSFLARLKPAFTRSTIRLLRRRPHGVPFQKHAVPGGEWPPSHLLKRVIIRADVFALTGEVLPALRGGSKTLPLSHAPALITLRSSNGRRLALNHVIVCHLGSADLQAKIVI